MNILVQKFGGTSVASIERIKCTAKTIVDSYSSGNAVVAVVSAMGGQTNHLIQLAKEITDNPNLREYDALLATGEQVTASLLSMCLQDMGYKSYSYNGAQVPITTSDNQTQASITNVSTNTLLKQLKSGVIPVVTGFQGVGTDKQTTTLGRGGSDLTAVAIAVALNATECQIYTDVDGVYSADPRIVPAAHKISSISSKNMLEMAKAGAKVMQYYAMRYAVQHKLPLRVLSSFNPGQGTLIKDKINDNRNKPIIGIALALNQCRICLEYQKEQKDLIKKLLQQLKLEIDVINFDAEDIIMEGHLYSSFFCINRYDLDYCLQSCNSFFAQTAQDSVRISYKKHLGRLSFIGDNLIAEDIKRQITHTLEQKSINILTMQVEAEQITLLVSIADIEAAAYHLHHKLIEQTNPS